MLTCPRRCSRMPSTALHRPSRSSILRRTSQPTSRRSLTRSTTPRGIALWDVTLGATSPTRPNTLSTSTLGRWQYCCSRVAKRAPLPLPPCLASGPGAAGGRVHY